mgnify:CR=1 FL=1
MKQHVMTQLKGELFCNFRDFSFIFLSANHYQNHKPINILRYRTYHRTLIIFWTYLRTNAE